MLVYAPIWQFDSLSRVVPVIYSQFLTDGGITVFNQNGLSHLSIYNFLSTYRYRYRYRSLKLAF